MKKYLYSFSTYAFLALSLLCAEALSLEGNWGFAFDPQDQGEKENWFLRSLSDQIPLPGTTDEAGKSVAGKTKVNEQSIHPQLLDADPSKAPTNHLSRRFPYVGVAWYQRDVEIPNDWKNKRVTLQLERTKLSTVWIDDYPLGQQDSLLSNHCYEIPSKFSGGKHRLTIRVDNRIEKLPARGHQVSEDTQTNWNGIIGKIELQAKSPIWIERVATFPNAKKRLVHVRVTLGNQSGVPAKGKLVLTSTSSAKQVTATESFNQLRDGESVETTIELGSKAPLWNEFNPALHELKVELVSEKGEKDEYQTRFGLRDFSTRGAQFILNEKPVLLRGRHDACVFPLTGYPPMKKQGWLDYFKTCRDYGLNHVRFHTWCPPRAAFEAADEMGILLQPELCNFGGDFGMDYERRRYSMAEAQRMLNDFGNSPSFALFALGNENFKSRETRAAMLREFRTMDRSRRLYTQVSNPDFSTCIQSPEDDYWVTFRSRLGSEGNIRGSYSHADLPLGHIQTGPANTVHDYEEALRDLTCPLISHEIGQFQVYPDFREIDQYRGILRATNFEIFRERLTKAGMLDQAHDFFKASGALAVINYREEIEAVLRTPKMGGFQLLDLQDFPGQGTALVGILNAFMESKGLITPEEWRSFCSPTVLLAKFSKYTWKAGETFNAEVAIANYGLENISRQKIAYELKEDQGKVWASGDLPISVNQGEVTASVEKISIPLPGNLNEAQKVTLEIRLIGTEFKNRYSLWVYPTPESRMVTSNSNVVVSTRLDETLKGLQAGKKVFYIPSEEHRPTQKIEGFFASDFWCFPMFKHVAIANKKTPAPGTLGLLVQPKHLALKGFPTDIHTDYQWFNIVMKSYSVILDSFPKGFKPIVQVIDNFDRNHRLGMIFEAQVGKGKLLFCGADLKGLQETPEGNQLLNSLFNYAESNQFAPSNAVDLATVTKVLQLSTPKK